MRIKFLVLVVSSIIILAFALASAQDFDEVQFNAIKVADRIYMLEGAGGNIGVF